jgi:group I intron endonuclease
MTKVKGTWILYRTENLINQKIYVGVHRLQNTAKSKNYLGSGDGLKSAIKIYGKENFLRTTLAEFSRLEDAYLAEAEMVTQEFINRPDTYNMCLGGHGGGIQTPEMRAKISKANKGKVPSEATRDKLRKLNSKKTHTEETKIKISIANKGRIMTQEQIAKAVAANKGRKHTPEAKAKMSISQKGRVHSEKTKNLMGASNPKNLAVMVEGKFYISMSHAAREKGIKRATLQQRVKSTTDKFANYRFATEEEKLDYFSRSTILAEGILDVTK